MDAQNRPLPKYVQQEFDEYLKYGRLEYGFLRLTVLSNGNIRYQIKTPNRDGTTHVIFEPLDFIAMLSALIPKPGVNLTRYYAVFAPKVGPMRGRLKREFSIDVETCNECGGAVKVTA